MWPALAKKAGIDPNSVTWVNIDANAKLSALKAKTVDVTTSFFNLHHVFARELGSDMGFLAWKDAGVNPYGNSIIANGAWLKANHDKADKFVKITQKAFAECAKKPDPCIKALVEANGALLYQNELDNWHLVTILMNDETSRTVALGWHDDARMADDYRLVDEYLKMEKPYDVQDGLHQRVPRQEREDAADQSAEAVLMLGAGRTRSIDASSCTAAGPFIIIRIPGRPRQRCARDRRSARRARCSMRVNGRCAAKPRASRNIADLRLGIGEVDEDRRRDRHRARERAARSATASFSATSGTEMRRRCGRRGPDRNPTMRLAAIARRARPPASARASRASTAPRSRAKCRGIEGAQRRPIRIGDGPDGNAAGAAMCAPSACVLPASRRRSR